MYICIVRSFTENIYPFRPPPSVTQICVADLLLEDPRLGEDATVDGPQARVCPAFYLVSVLLFYTIRWPFLLNGYIFSDKLYK